MEGESGGGYIIIGVGYELAKRNQTNLCKMIFPRISMGGDYLVKTPVEKRKLEVQKEMKDGQEICYYHLAEDLEKQKNDP